jgi:hypothetical protein
MILGCASMDMYWQLGRYYWSSLLYIYICVYVYIITPNHNGILIREITLNKLVCMVLYKKVGERNYTLRMYILM